MLNLIKYKNYDLTVKNELNLEDWMMDLFIYLKLFPKENTGSLPCVGIIYLGNDYLFSQPKYELSTWL